MGEAIIVSRGGGAAEQLIVDVSIRNSNNAETFAQNAMVNVFKDGRSIGVYNTGSLGRFYFIAEKGHSYNFIEEGNGLPYIDVTYNNINNFIPNGNESVVLIRKPNTSSYTVTKNQNIIFSDGCKSVDVYCSGGGGGGGGGGVGATSLSYWWSGSTCSYEGFSSTNYNGGHGGNGYTNNYIGFNPTANLNYSIYIGNGGAGGAGNSNIKSATMNSNDSYKAWSIGITGTNGKRGNTGETTTFGSILSANGGSYGGYASNEGIGSNGKGGYGSIGGDGGNGYGDWYISFSRVRVSAYANSGKNGSAGYVIINNFAYK